MNSTDPLAQLRDIHLPEPVSVWPPAPGWWLIAAAVLLLVIVVAKALIRRHQRRAFQQQALAELKQLDELDLQPAEHLQTLNRLLKRTALICHSNKQVASLSGEEWLAFLDQSGNTQQFSQGDGRWLMDGPYVAPSENTPTRDQLQNLTELAQQWLKKQQRQKGQCQP